MRIAFLGTPDVAVPTMRALLDAPQHEIVAAVTQPDRARGRGREVTASPVKALALEHGLPVLQPASPKEDGFADALRARAPEVLVVVAYGHILPVAVLEVAPAINAHFSILPSYRGAAPVQRALMDGATETGVSVFLLEPSVDSGPVLRVARTPIDANDDAGSLLERLAPIGAQLVLESLDALVAGERGSLQDPALASPAPKIKPEEQLIDWSQPATVIVNRIRGLSPRPGAYTLLDGKRLGIRRAHPTDAPADGAHGTATRDGDTLQVASGDGTVVLDEVQPEGKRVLPVAEFLRGARITAPIQLG
jgi:methionyl-tRNA formyltransferase